MKSKKIVLHGIITKAADYNTKEILKGLPVKRRNQIIEVLLDENFWKILHLKNKRIKIIIDEEQIPAELKEKQ